MQSLSNPKTAQLFNPLADIELMKWRQFYTRPLNLIIEQIRANPDDAQLSVFHTERFFSGQLSNAEKIILTAEVELIAKKPLSKRSAVDDFFLNCFINHTPDDHFYLAAEKGLVYAQVFCVRNERLALQYGLNLQILWENIEKAATQNNPHALYATAQDLTLPEHRNDARLAVTFDKQFKNLKKAASLGHPSANEFLAELYENGLVITVKGSKQQLIPRDQVQSRSHYRLAMAGGNSAALQVLLELACREKNFAMAACYLRFGMEYLPYQVSFPVYYKFDLNHPEVIYHLGTCLNKYIPNYSPKEIAELRTNFNNLAILETSLFLQLLNWETSVDQIRIRKLLSPDANECLDQHLNYAALCALTPGASATATALPSVARSAFSQWSSSAADTKSDLREGPRDKSVFSRPH